MRKKMVLLVFALAILVTPLTFAAEKKAAAPKTAAEKKPAPAAVTAGNKRSLISTPPLALTSGALFINYEYALNDKTSIAPTFGTYSYSSGDWKESLTNIGCGYNFFPNKNSLSGFYLGPRVELWMISYEFKERYYSGFTIVETNHTGSLSALALKLQLAQRWLWDSGLNIELGANFGYASGTLTVNGVTGTYTFNVGSIPMIGWGPIFNIGYAF